MEFLGAIQWDNPAIFGPIAAAVVAGVFAIVVVILKRKKASDDGASGDSTTHVENKPSNVFAPVNKIGLDEKDVGKELKKAVEPLRQDIAALKAGPAPKQPLPDSETSATTTPGESAEPGPEHDLSKEARHLLLEAVKDPHGSIMKVRTSGGLTVQTNNKNMVTAPNDGRCEALWEGAVDELLDNDLIADHGYKGEVFRVTRTGYELADFLGQQA